MSKRRRAESQEDYYDDAETWRSRSSRTPSEPPPTPRPRGLFPWSHPAKCPSRQRHLYLVLDDWKRGYSIHRLGDDAFAPCARPAGAGAEPSPPPPLVRVQANHAYTCSFAAHGSKILAMHPRAFAPGVPVFDTATLEMAVYPFPRSRSINSMWPLVHASVGGGGGDRLACFVHRHMELLGPEPPPDAGRDQSSWSWAAVEPPPPFDSSHVSGYALHPDGRTIFVSVKDWSNKGFDKRRATHVKRSSTFAFDTERLEWAHLGDWLLPFSGRAHYDGELDAWVGICAYEEGAGHVCCCDVPPAAAAGCVTMPAWTFGRDAVFDGGSDRHWGATLVYMGHSRFCLVEARVAEHYDSDPRHRELTMTSFGLKYDKAGELVTAEYRAYASISYQTQHHHPGHGLDPVAFWM